MANPWQKRLRKGGGERTIKPCRSWAAMDGVSRAGGFRCCCLPLSGHPLLLLFATTRPSGVRRSSLVIPPIVAEAKEEDTGQWGRSVDVGSWARTNIP